jgi:hypothetical protein
MSKNSQHVMFLLALAFTVSASSADSRAIRNPKEGVVVGSGPAATAVLWREPADIASRNLFYGAEVKTISLTVLLHLSRRI